jgi:phosphohistidine phosphatase
MKTLILMRHANSTPLQLSKTDRDRALSIEGMRELEFMRRKLQGHIAGLSLVLCSNAKRTRQTLEGLRSILPASAEIIYEDRLYNASLETVLECIHEVDSKHKTIMLIGHNPALSQILEASIQTYSTTGVPTYLSNSAAAFFEVNTGKWGTLSLQNLRLQSFFMPS